MRLLGHQFSVFLVKSQEFWKLELKLLFELVIEVLMGDQVIYRFPFLAINYKTTS